MTDLHPNELLPAYSLGCLEADELERVEQHLHQCDHCRRELAELQNVTAWMAHAVPGQQPRKILRERVLSQCRRQPRLAWFEALLDRWPRLVPSVALGSLAGFILTGLAGLLFWFSAPAINGDDPIGQL